MSKIVTFSVAIYLFSWWTCVIMIDDYEVINLIFLSISILLVMVCLIFHDLNFKRVTKK